MWLKVDCRDRFENCFEENQQFMPDFERREKKKQIKSNLRDVKSWLEAIFGISDKLIEFEINLFNLNYQDDRQMKILNQQLRI